MNVNTVESLSLCGTQTSLLGMCDAVELNTKFQKKTSDDIIQFVLQNANYPVIFSNFRPLAMAFLHRVLQQKNDIPVIWIDHGFNTKATYNYIDSMVEKHDIHLRTYAPKVSAAHYLSRHKGIPALDSVEHARFTKIMKIEPFQRALREVSPDVWMNGIRHDQNTFRQDLNIFTKGSDNTVRVAPMFHLTELEVEEYLFENNLEDNPDYFDPTKGDEQRECGLLLQQ